jgi:RNA polymerase sigma-70 factor, ECF subfamily
MSLATAAPTRKARRLPAKSWMNDPEVCLMLQVQQDDAGAFAELVKRYWPLVFGQFFRKLGRREEAEDLAQDVFLRVYRHRKRYKPQAKFATWLYRIAQNVLLNALRSRHRHPAMHLEAMTHIAGMDVANDYALPDRAEAPSRSIERNELARVVHAAVSGLAARQRTAVELHQFHDRTYSEVAAELHMTPKAAKSLLYRARNQLRICLSPFMEA